MALTRGQQYLLQRQQEERQPTQYKTRGMLYREQFPERQERSRIAQAAAATFSPKSLLNAAYNVTVGPLVNFQSNLEKLPGIGNMFRDSRVAYDTLKREGYTPTGYVQKQLDKYPAANAGEEGFKQGLRLGSEGLDLLAQAAIAGGAQKLIGTAGNLVATKPAIKMTADEVKTALKAAQRGEVTLPQPIKALTGSERAAAVRQGFTSSERVPRSLFEKVLGKPDASKYQPLATKFLPAKAGEGRAATAAYTPFAKVQKPGAPVPLTQEQVKAMMPVQTGEVIDISNPNITTGVGKQLADIIRKITLADEPPRRTSPLKFTSDGSKLKFATEPAAAPANVENMTGRQIQSLGNSEKQVAERAVTDKGLQTQAAVDAVKTQGTEADTQKALDFLKNLNAPATAATTPKTVADLNLPGFDDIADVQLVFDKKSAGNATIVKADQDGNRFVQIRLNPSMLKPENRAQLGQTLAHEQAHIRDVKAGIQNEASTINLKEFKQYIQSPEGMEAFRQTKLRMPDATADDIGRQVMFDRYQARPEEVRARAAAQRYVNPEVSGTGETKARSLSQSITDQAIKKDVPLPEVKTPTYQQLSMKEQDAKVQAFMQSNYEQAKNIAMGLESPPEGILPEDFLRNVVKKAEQENDVATIMDLSNKSTLVSEATTLGQRIKAMDLNDEHSAFSSIRKVRKLREEVAAKRHGNIAKAQQKEVSNIAAEVKKAAPKVKDWASFIDSIRCT